MKKFIKNITLLLATLTIVSCGSSTKPVENETTITSSEEIVESTKQTETSEYDTLRLAMMPTVNQIVFYVAKEEGFYDEFGVKIELIPFSSAKDRNAAILGDALDGASSDMLSTAMFKKAGIDMRIITGTVDEFGLLVHEDSGIETVADLGGKTIFYSKNSVIEYLIDKMLEEVGLTQDDVVMEEVPVLPARLELLREGKGDSALLPDPFKTIAEKEGFNIIKNNYDVNTEATVIAITNDYYEKNKGNVEGFLKAYDKSVEFLSTPDGEAKYEDFILETLGFPEEFKGVFKLPELKKSFMPSKEVVEDALQWAYKKGLTDDKLSYEEVILDSLYN